MKKMLWFLCLILLFCLCLLTGCDMPNDDTQSFESNAIVDTSQSEVGEIDSNDTHPFDQNPTDTQGGEDTVAGEHMHTFANEWSSDDDYHWREATCGHANEIVEKSEHVIGAEGIKCIVCEKVLISSYETYSDYIKDCDVRVDGNVITVVYDRELPIILKFGEFTIDGTKNYVFKFGSNATYVKIDGGGSAFHNIVIDVESRNTDFSLALDSISLSNPNSVITSAAPCLKLSFQGSSCLLSTTNAANGEIGESYGAFQIGNGGIGGKGGDANTVIVCEGMLNIYCSTNVNVRGGNGGQGGNGGNSDSSGSIGGNGGNGGNGGMGASATAIKISFEEGWGKEHISFVGGLGGVGGAGGYGSLLYGLGKKYASNGSNGESAYGTSAVIQYE